jgi:hypothetical protein
LSSFMEYEKYRRITSDAGTENARIKSRVFVHFAQMNYVDMS